MYRPWDQDLETVFMMILKSLKQIRSVKEYQESFEELLNRVDLPEQYAVSCFIRGLKEEIQLAKRMFVPRVLQHAVGLPKIEEARILNALKQGKFSGPSQGNTSYAPNAGSSSNYPRQNSSYNASLLLKPGERGARNMEGQKRSSKFMSTTEMDEKRDKGLCYWCDERYTPGHQCKRR